MLFLFLFIAVSCLSAPVPAAIPPIVGPIYRIAWSPDGKTLAAVARQGLILYDAVTLAPLRILDADGRTGPLAYSPDGARLACTCGEGLIQIWDVKSGQLLKTLTDAKGFTSVAFSPDGTQLAGGTRNGSVNVWDSQGEKLLLTLSGPEGDVDALAYGSDSKQILSGSSLTGTVRVWSAESGQVLHAFPDHSEFFGIVFSPDSTRMAASNIGGDSIKVWNMQSGALLATIPTEVTRFTFSPDSNVIVCACKEGLVAWNASDGKSLGTIAPNDPSIYFLAFSPDGKRLALGTRDGMIKTLNWATPTSTPPIPSPRPSVLDVYPLGLGATWAYSATLDYEENNKPVHWTGTMTETITSVTAQDSAFVFDAEWQGRPAHSGFGLPISQYVALGNRIYALWPPTLPESLLARQGQGYESAQALAWPMSVGEQWGDPRDMARGDGYLVWRVEGKEDLTTPAGTFKDCYRLFFLSNPDDTTRWFCPGVGIARYEYHHHGSLFNEVWELQRRVPGALLPPPSSSPALHYADPSLCFSVDVPSDWTYVDAGRGGFAAFGPKDKPTINITNVSFSETATMDRALDDLKRGSLGPYIQSTESEVVDGHPALWVTLTPGQEFQFVVLVIPRQCTASQHALFISAREMDRPSFEAFLKGVHLN